MRVSITDAKAKLDDLVQRAQAGDEIILSLHGGDAVRLAPLKATPDRATRRALLDELRAAGARKATPGPSAARSQDFLYDDRGLPA